MREALLLAIAVFAFVGAAFVPGGAIDSAQDSARYALAGTSAEVPVRSSFSPTATTGYAAWVAGTTELPRAADGHFYADALVDGTPVRFLVDTGASMVALTGADARALGLSWSDSDIRIVAQGASGPVRGVFAELDSIRLGGHKAHAVEAVIVPHGLGVSLLGQSFLATVQPLRIEGDRMVLGE